MKLLIVEDDELMQSTLRAVFTEHDITQAKSMADAMVALQKDVYSVAFLDINLKAGTVGDGIDLLKKIREGDRYLPCVMISALGDAETVKKCLDLGAVDYVVKASGGAEVYQLALYKALTWRRLVAENQAERLTSMPAQNPYEMYGKSSALKTLKENLNKIGQLPGPFLILGETGVGKELVARQIWRSAGDPYRPFVALNAASLPENLVESELFGYERGAFTGALTTKTGLFEAANGGDIFLDEIGELSVDLQAKLLRVLQERRVRRLGSDKERPVNFRVIAATNVDLLNAVEEGDFREDLFFRINVHQIKVPTLRERITDVPQLLFVFWGEMGIKEVFLSKEVQGLLDEFSWPGNIRQLKSFSQAMVPHLGQSAELPFEAVQEWMRANDLKRRSSQGFSEHDILAELKGAFTEKRSVKIVAKLDLLQKAYVETALKVTNNNRSQAAKLLGVSRQRLSNWLSEWGV